MMKGDSLVYGETASFLTRWELENQILNALFIAALLTILSYQATEVLLDLFFGLKRPFVSSISNLYILLSIRQFSPLSVVASLLPQHPLLRLKFHVPSSVPIPSPTEADQSTGKTSLRPTIRFFVLLASAPVINIITIVLSLEGTEQLTVEQAKFGNISFGINDDFSVLKLEPYDEFCFSSPLVVERGARSLAEFAICRSYGHFLKDLNTSGAHIDIADISHRIINIVVRIGPYVGTSSSSSSVFVNNVPYALRLNTKILNGSKFLLYALRLMAEECGLPNADHATNEPPPHNITYVNSLWRKSVPNCIPRDENSSERIIKRLTSITTITKADKFEISEFPEDPRTPPVFFDGRHMPLLQLRRRAISLVQLLILTIGVLLARALTASVCRNDVDLGLEMILKKRLGFKCCDSFLWSKGREVVYNSDGTPGNVTLYKKTSHRQEVD